MRAGFIAPDSAPETKSDERTGQPHEDDWSVAVHWCPVTEGHGKVRIDHVAGHDDAMLKGLVQSHLLYTGSDRARRVLENWSAYLPKFVKVMPLEYKRALSEMAEEQARRESRSAPPEMRAHD